MTIRGEMLDVGERAVILALEARETPRDIAAKVWRAMSSVRNPKGPPVRRPDEQREAMDMLRRGAKATEIRERFGFGGYVISKLQRQLKKERERMVGEAAA